MAQSLEYKDLHRAEEIERLMAENSKLEISAETDGTKSRRNFLAERGHALWTTRLHYFGLWSTKSTRFIDGWSPVTILFQHTNDCTVKRPTLQIFSQQLRKRETRCRHIQCIG